jgi:hypothetical protein
MLAGRNDHPRRVDPRPRTCGRIYTCACKESGSTRRALVDLKLLPSAVPMSGPPVDRKTPEPRLRPGRVVVDPPIEHVPHAGDCEAVVVKQPGREGRVGRHGRMKHAGKTRATSGVPVLVEQDRSDSCRGNAGPQPRRVTTWGHPGLWAPVAPVPPRSGGAGDLAQDAVRIAATTLLPVERSVPVGPGEPRGVGREVPIDRIHKCRSVRGEYGTCGVTRS